MLLLQRPAASRKYPGHVSSSSSFCPPISSSPSLFFIFSDPPYLISPIIHTVAIPPDNLSHIPTPPFSFYASLCLFSLSIRSACLFRCPRWALCPAVKARGMSGARRMQGRKTNVHVMHVGCREIKYVATHFAESWCSKIFKVTHISW